MERNSLFIGDVSDWAATLAAHSIHCIVTSPPYFQLRKYGTPPTAWPEVQYRPLPMAGIPAVTIPAMTCDLGLEPTPEAYIGHLLHIFRLLAPALHPTGTMFINIADSYSRGRQGRADGGRRADDPETWKDYIPPAHRDSRRSELGEKQLLGIPALLAFALQADGWYLRQKITWAKRAPMPESVRDRCTSATEEIFMFAKQPRYYFDQEAVREPHAEPGRIQINSGRRYADESIDPHVKAQAAGNANGYHPLGRNLRNWWLVDADEDDPAPDLLPSQMWILGPEPFGDAHFATYPREIPRRAIRAGTSAYGCCGACGSPWRRVVERKPTGWDGHTYGERAVAASGGAKSGGTARSTLGSSNGKLTADYQTTGWEPTCRCGRTDVRPAVVLDCFAGSGTTLAVAVEEGRDYVGCDLDERARGWLAGRLAKVQRRLPLDLVAD